MRSRRTFRRRRYRRAFKREEPMYEVTVDELASLLREAEAEHAKYEKSLGHADSDWPTWYARYVLDQIEKDDVE